MEEVKSRRHTMTAPGRTVPGGWHHMGDAGRTGGAAERARLSRLMMALWQGPKPPGSQPGKVAGANRRRR